MFFRLVDHILNKLRPIGSPTFDGSIFKSLLVGFILGVNQIIKIVLLKRNRVGFSILHNRDVIDGEIGIETDKKSDIAIGVRPFRAVNPRGRGIDGHWIKITSNVFLYQSTYTVGDMEIYKRMLHISKIDLDRIEQLLYNEGVLLDDAEPK